MTLEIIAEVGSTWRVPDRDTSRLLAAISIAEAAEAGATIVKFQVFRQDSLYSKERAPDLHKRIKEYELPLEWLPELQQVAKINQVQLWASIFAEDLIEPTLPYLDGIKLASGDFTNHLLMTAMINAAAKSNKPLAISLGAVSDREFGEVLYQFHHQMRNVQSLILLHCVSAYPALEEHMNLRFVKRLWGRSKAMGLSDHTHGVLASQLALALGCTYFEKHFAPSGADWDNPDAKVGLRPDAFHSYVNALKHVETVLGTSEKIVQESEASERIGARRGKDGLRPADD